MVKSSCVMVISLLLLLIISSSHSSPTLDVNLNPTDSFIQCLMKSNIIPSLYPITKAIYTPNNPSFPSIFKTYARNLRYVYPQLQYPLVMVAASHESHVQATVVCSKANNLLLRTRSSGHDYEAASYVSQDQTPFILLDMFNLRNWSIDLASERMWVQSGATLGEVYYNIAAKSKIHAFPAGLCPTVALGGHFSGGGFGTMVRKYGLATDNMVDAQIVDVNGRILDRKAMGEDLFWAIRGGGGASFGVVLSWTINLVKIPEVVTAFTATRTIEQGATELVQRWQEVASTMSEDMFIRLELRADQQKKTIEVTFLGFFLGNMEKVFPLMNENFPTLKLQRDECTEMSWIESVLYFYNYPKGTPITVLLERVQKEDFFKSTSDFVKQPILKEGLEDIWQKMMKIGGDVVLKLNPYGGMMNKIPASQTPTPHRAGYLYKIQYLATWHEQNKTGYYLNASRQVFEAMTPYVTKSPREAFLNYRDLDIGSSLHANATYEEAKVYGVKYFNENFDRLVQVKTKVDPGNFFRNEQSIPVLAKKNV